jgi:hypothetical protein
MMTTSSPVNLTYGTDLKCVEDFDPGMIEASGNLVLANACARRLITPRGTYVGDANYGYDIKQFLGDDLSPQQVGKIQSNIAAELQKDQRVQSVSAIAVLATSTSILTVTAVIEGALGPFSLVLSVTDLAATITVSP